MLTLLSPDGSQVEIVGRTLVGRSSTADLRIDDTLVSGEHAVLRWTGERWELRDLGSRNGTFVDERTLSYGDRVGLAPNTRFAFGDARRVWRVTSVDAPIPAARAADGTLHRGGGNLLALPSDQQPDVIIYLDDGAWLAERPDAEPVVVENGEVFAVDGRCFTLLLPTEDGSTLATADATPSIHTLAITFRLSADEEHAAAAIRERGAVIDLGARSHHYMLATLARARLADARRGVGAEEAGWVYQSELCKGLRISESQLYLLVHRARRQLADAGIRGARRVVERRRASGQLRLGVADCRVLAARPRS